MSNYESQAELDDATCLLLGRFVMYFSGLIHSLENAVELLSAFVSEQDKINFKTSVSKVTAGQMLHKFTSIYSSYWGSNFRESDLEVFACVNEELKTLIDQRNRLKAVHLGVVVERLTMQDHVAIERLPAWEALRLDPAIPLAFAGVDRKDTRQWAEHRR